MPDVWADRLLQSQSEPARAGHFEATGHPMIRSAEPGEDWQWCYVDDRLYAAEA